MDIVFNLIFSMDGNSKVGFEVSILVNHICIGIKPKKYPIRVVTIVIDNIVTVQRELGQQKNILHCAK